MSVNQVGSSLFLFFQSKSITFTPDIFTKLFEEKGYTETTGEATISLNPNASPIQTVYFSKDNLMVYYNPSELLIMFQIMNTLDFADLYERDINPVLTRLNFIPQVVQAMGLTYTTRITSEKSPLTSISSLVKPDFISNISNLVGVNNIYPFTMRLVGGEVNESFDLVIEPLITSSTDTFHLSLSYRTSDNSKFNDFVNIFNEDLIENIIKEVTENA